MTIQRTRRDIIRGGLAVAGASVLGVPKWVLPVLAQGETLVQFTDIPDNVASWSTKGSDTVVLQLKLKEHFGWWPVNPSSKRVCSGMLGA